MKRSLYILSAVSIILWSCIKTQEVSPIPFISFQSFDVELGYDSLGNLKPIGTFEFTFIDGDADIGLYPEEVDTFTWKESNYNVFLIPYEKIDTSYILIEPDSSKPPSYYKIWYDEKLDRVGQNKTIRGTVIITIDDLPQFDTIRYEFFIRDRAGHISNTAITTDIGTQIDMPAFN
jgi:hypothetical protein